MGAAPQNRRRRAAYTTKETCEAAKGKWTCFGDDCNCVKRDAKGFQWLQNWISSLFGDDDEDEDEDDEDEDEDEDDEDEDDEDEDEDDEDEDEDEDVNAPEPISEMVSTQNRTNTEIKNNTVPATNTGPTNNTKTNNVPATNNTKTNTGLGATEDNLQEPITNTLP